VEEYAYLCLVDKRMASYCRKMGERVWKMFILRDFPALPTQQDECKEKAEPYKCTYAFYKRSAVKMPNGYYAFFSPDVMLVESFWRLVSHMWFLNPDTRQVTNFAVTNQGSISRLTRQLLDEGRFGLVGYLRPPDGRLVLFTDDLPSRRIYRVMEEELYRPLGFRRKQTHFESLLRKRQALEEEIVTLAEDLRRLGKVLDAAGIN